MADELKPVGDIAAAVYRDSYAFSCSLGSEHYDEHSRDQDVAAIITALQSERDRADAQWHAGAATGAKGTAQAHKDALDSLADALGERDKAVADLAALEWRVVANAPRLSRSGRIVRWAHVVDATGYGSTSATEMCRRAGFDPCEMVGTDGNGGGS